MKTAGATGGICRKWPGSSRKCTSRPRRRRRRLLPRLLQHPRRHDHITSFQGEAMNTRLASHIYEGTGDDLAEQLDTGNRIILLPDAIVEQRGPDPLERVRIMWGQR